MLPLEKLTEEAEAGVREHGVDTAALDLVLELDLDHEGNFGESWLAFEKKSMTLYMISVTSDNDTEQKRKKARAAAADAMAKSGKKGTAPAKFVIPDLFKNCYFWFNQRYVKICTIDCF